MSKTVVTGLPSNWNSIIASGQEEAAEVYGEPDPWIWTPELRRSVSPLVVRNRLMIWLQRTGGSSCWSRRTRCCAERQRICRRQTLTQKAFPGVRDLAADQIPVTVSCRVLGLCRQQQYYRWLRAPFTEAELDEAWLANAVFDAHADDPEFGYRFLADEVRDQGWDVSDRAVWRICSENGWWANFAKPRRNRKAPPTHCDVPGHRKPSRPQGFCRLWFVDIVNGGV